MNDFDLSAYMGVFLDEMNEQQHMLDKSLLELEESGCQPETIQVIFRAAHTLKGSSAAMGFQGLKELMHKVENIFDQLRNDRVQVSPELMNGLFQCADYIKRQRELFLQGIYEEQPVDDLVSMLEHVNLTIDSDTSESESQGGIQVCLVQVDIQPESEMKAVRAMLIWQKLQQLGELQSTPSATTQSTSSEDSDEDWNRTLEYVLTTNVAPSDIEVVLNEISQLARVEVMVLPAERPVEEPQQYEAQRPLESNEFLATTALPVEAVPAREPVAAASQTIRVDVKRLEHLLNLVGELLIDNTRLLDVKKRLNEKYSQEDDIATLDDIIHHLSRIVSDMRDGMMKTRMIPIDHLFSRLPRVIRDLSQLANKEINLTIEGKETELDRTLIEEISDPLLHILRNAADHGLESPEEREALGKPRKGQITIKASHQENAIAITIADDGRGIDPVRIMQKALDKGFISSDEASQMSDKQIISLIFHSGMSTAEQVTELSGRGVGMDIVRSHIEKLNGLVEIDTRKGEGTVFTLKLPLTLAIIRSLLIQLEHRTIAIPLVNVIEIFRLQEQEIQTLHGQEVCAIRGEILPLIRLDRLLGTEKATDGKTNPNKMFVVMVGMAEKRVCLLVDRLIGNQEIVIKSLDDFIGHVPFIVGTTILGDGLVALILDVNAVIHKAGTSLTRFGSREREELHKQAPKKELVTFKLDSIWYAVEIEHVQEIINSPQITKLAEEDNAVVGVMNLRDHLLPVYDLTCCLGIRRLSEARHARVLILHTGTRKIGITVDEVAEVLSIYEHEIETDSGARNAVHALVGSIVKRDKRLIQVLNMEQVMVQLEGAAV
jgi:two-component system chemotaxis sensor kinase CheA